jgi:hypothetical protein
LVAGEQLGRWPYAVWELPTKAKRMGAVFREVRKYLAMFHAVAAFLEAIPDERTLADLAGQPRRRVYKGKPLVDVLNDERSVLQYERGAA